MIFSSWPGGYYECSALPFDAVLISSMTPVVRSGGRGLGDGRVPVSRSRCGWASSSPLEGLDTARVTPGTIWGHKFRCHLSCPWPMPLPPLLGDGTTRYAQLPLKAVVSALEEESERGVALDNRGGP